MARKHYDREFWVSAVKLVAEQGYTLRRAAESLGVSVQAIRTWRSKLRQDGVTFHNPSESAEEELRRLRAENKRLTMERDILKKAATYFATLNQ
jgi:transposase